MASELKTLSEPPANRTPRECMTIETAFSQLYTMDQFSSLMISKINILGGNNKTAVWSAACPISDLFGKGELILVSAYASPNIGSPLPNKPDIGQ